MAAWEDWLSLALQHLSDTKLLRSLRPIANVASEFQGTLSLDEIHQECGPWDKQAVRVHVSGDTFRQWLRDEPSTGIHHDAEQHGSQELTLFSGNDYLGLSAHPLVRSAAAKAACAFGMGPRGSALICGYTQLHRSLETAIAQLKKTEECLLCPTGFAANMGVMSAVCTTIPGFRDETIAIFSDALNHASIIDGVRLAQKLSKAEVHVYRHNDMLHLKHLLSACERKRKIVVTDSLFSMDGDFAPLDELVDLKKVHNFLLVVDDAHGTLACGKDGGGVAEAYGVESDVDIYIGTLSKAFGCHGGFISSSQKWKQLIQSRGRSFIFSTSNPMPVVAAAHAALVVAREEKWRRQALWSRVKQLSKLTGLELQSYIVPIVIGDPERTLAASKHLLKAGFHVTAIRPPTVAKSSSRLRITLCASHSSADIEALYQALIPWLTSGKHRL